MVKEKEKNQQASHVEDSLEIKNLAKIYLTKYTKREGSFDFVKTNL